MYCFKINYVEYLALLLCWQDDGVASGFWICTCSISSESSKSVLKWNPEQLWTIKFFIVMNSNWKNCMLLFKIFNADKMKLTNELKRRNYNLLFFSWQSSKELTLYGSYDIVRKEVLNKTTESLQLNESWQISYLRFRFPFLSKLFRAFTVGNKMRGNFKFD